MPLSLGFSLDQRQRVVDALADVRLLGGGAQASQRAPSGTQKTLTSLVVVAVFQLGGACRPGGFV
jgi:hypothetical protein